MNLVTAALVLAAVVLFVSGISLIGGSTASSVAGALLIVAAAGCEFRSWKRWQSHRP